MIVFGRRLTFAVTFAVILFATCSCEISPARTAVSRQSLLVGDWICKAEFGFWTVTRRADGTFYKRGAWSKEWGAEPEPYVTEGTWSLHGDAYVEVTRKTVSKAWPEKKGKKLVGRVLSVSVDKFEWKGRDTPIFIERRMNAQH